MDDLTKYRQKFAREQERVEVSRRKAASALEKQKRSLIVTVYDKRGSIQMPFLLHSNETVKAMLRRMGKWLNSREVEWTELECNGYTLKEDEKMRKKTKNPVFEQYANAAYGVKYRPASSTTGAKLTFTPLVNCPAIKAVSYPYEASDLASFAAKHVEKMTGMNVYYFKASQKSGFICILMAKNSKVQNPKWKHVNPSRKVTNPRFAVSLESQHGTKPVGIIEAPNFLSAYNAAKKEYGPDIDVDTMNPIRRYVVTKRKKAAHGRMR